MVEPSRGAHVLIFPFPALGHMLSLLDLAHHLSSTTNLAVTVVVTTKNRPLLDPLLARSPEIEPLVLPFPSDPSIPSGVENLKDLPPFYFVPMKRALAALHRPLFLWARSHPSPPVAIISDMFLGWTHSLAADLAIPRLVFSPSAAITIAIINSLWRRMPKPSPTLAFPSIPGSPVYPWYQLSTIYRQYIEGDPFWEFIREGFNQNMRSWGYVINTFDAIEGHFMQHLKEDLGHPRVWAVGPLCDGGAAATDRGGPTSVPAAQVLDWLDRFEEGSVLYVCFGSQVVLSPPQAAALGVALERSEARFVWCVKDGGSVPDGFDERVADRGMVIRGWAPQMAVLGHCAVGWFLTHCGWNSTLEALASGVAMLTWPMTADQYMDARLVAEAGVGVPVCDGADAVPDPDEVARIIREAVGRDRPERARASELRREAAAAVEECGSSRGDTVALVEALNMLARED